MSLEFRCGVRPETCENPVIVSRAHRALRTFGVVHSALMMAVAIGVVVALVIAIGPAIPLVTLGLMLAVVALRWRHNQELRALARRDPDAYYKQADRDMTRFGWYFAGMSFLVMAVGTVAIIWVLATHA